MNFLNFKFGKKSIPFEAPDSWAEVPFYKFAKFQKGNLTPRQVYELFTNIGADYWDKPHHAKLYASIDGQLAFLSTEPKTSIPDELERNGKFYPIKKDFLNVTADKYFDLMQLYKDATSESDNLIDVMPKMIAIFACIDYDDEEELNKIAKEIEKMPSDLVYSLGVFFCQKLSELNHGTQKKWLKVIAKKILTIPRLVLTKLLVSLVIFILLIVSPKVTLQSIIQFLKRKLSKFIDRNSYKVVRINQKHYTIT